METLGIVRKIDDLGRIVIPKELRKSLNIKNNEEIELILKNDELILRKYFKLRLIKDIVEEYFNKLSKYIEFQYIVTDREKIILTSSEQKNLIGQMISTQVGKLIDDRKQFQNLNSNDLYLTKENKVLNYYFFPIIVNIDAVGSIIAISNNKINEKQLMILDIINILIKNKLEFE